MGMRTVTMQIFTPSTHALIESITGKSAFETTVRTSLVQSIAHVGT